MLSTIQLNIAIGSFLFATVTLAGVAFTIYRLFNKIDIADNKNQEENIKKFEDLKHKISSLNETLGKEVIKLYEHTEKIQHNLIKMMNEADISIEKQCESDVKECADLMKKFEKEISESKLSSQNEIKKLTSKINELEDLVEHHASPLNYSKIVTDTVESIAKNSSYVKVVKELFDTINNGKH